MRIEQLEYLVELSKFNSINAASEHLHISHQCLNKSLTTLEKELDAKLINRSSKGIYLTKAGNQTLNSAKRILSELDALKTNLKNITTEPETLTGAATIIGTPATINTLLIPLTKKFKRNYPQVKITLIEANPLAIPEMLESDSYDFGVVNFTEHIESQFPELSFHPLFHEQTIAIVNKTSQLSCLPKISIQTLLNYPLLIYSASLSENDIIYQTLSQYGDTSNLVHTNSLQAYYETLAEGLYFSIVNPSVYFSMPSIYKANVGIVPIKEKIISTTYLVIKRNKKSPKIIEALFHDLQEYSITNN